MCGLAKYKKYDRIKINLHVLKRLNIYRYYAIESDLIVKMND